MKEYRELKEIEKDRYVLKEGGSVAGPKQQLGQHMMKRHPFSSRII